ncbi:MAG: glycosyltransferase, partial [Candidatus Jettenia caeni]|nr:glycosyltransferase [Candidatus Jettenia caeni]
MSERWEAINDPHTSISGWPSLSVIVPARNERASLPLTLPSWLEQDYHASEIVIIDDQSNDGTAKYASDSAARSNRMVRILDGSTPPPGWTGKLWALEQGVRSSSGEWLLFTDADILHRPNLWRGLMAKALTEQRAMVS